MRDPGQVRYRIGLVGQNASLDEILSGRENLVMFGRLLHLSAAAARRRAEDLLEQLDLAAAVNRPVADYSGGKRRRLDLAASLILSPPVLFLDEPTTGLDPRARIDAVMRPLTSPIIRYETGTFANSRPMSTPQHAKPRPERDGLVLKPSFLRDQWVASFEVATTTSSTFPRSASKPSCAATSLQHDLQPQGRPLSGLPSSNPFSSCSLSSDVNSNNAFWSSQHD